MDEIAFEENMKAARQTLELRPKEPISTSQGMTTLQDHMDPAPSARWHANETSGKP